MIHHYDVVRLGKILAVQAEIEGMKAENKQREIIGQSMAYSDMDFQDKASEFRNITNAPDDELRNH